MEMKVDTEKSKSENGKSKLDNGKAKLKEGKLKLNKLGSGKKSKLKEGSSKLTHGRSIKELKCKGADEPTKSECHTHWAYYDDWIQSVRPLDLLAFSGDDFISKSCTSVQRKARGFAEFSHIGICVNSEILPNVPQLEEGVMYVWESTISSRRKFDQVPDIESGKGRLGVQIRALEPVVLGYLKTEDCEVAVCRLKDSPWEDESKKHELVETMCELHEKHGRAVYELKVHKLFKAAIGNEKLGRLEEKVSKHWHKKSEEEKEFKRSEKMEEASKYIFCSELVGLVYKNLGILPEHINPEHIIPVDLIEGQFDIVEEPFYVHKRFENVHDKKLNSARSQPGHQSPKLVLGD